MVVFLSPDICALIVLRADVCKYRPEACNKENIKILKTFHKVSLGELLPEIYFYFDLIIILDVRR